MSQFSFSKEKTSDLSSLVFHFCFSIFSHPLYFSYFIFFFPYILKLVSFLSPLFITTTLLLLALFTVSPNYFVLDTNGDSESEFSDSKLGFLASNFQTLILWLHSKSNQKDEESGYLEEFEAYLVMFQASIFQALEAKPEENNSPQCLEADPVENNNVSVAEVKSLENLFHESEEFEDLSHQKEEKASSEMKVPESLFREDEDQKEDKLVDSELGKSEEETKEKMSLTSEYKVVEEEKKVLESMLQKEESEERKGKIGLRSGFKVMSKSQRLLEASLGSPENNWIYSESNYLGSFGSMRKEKEWRRTLACKLFEERHNNSNSISSNINRSESEGMDSLWETYNETESNKPKKKKNNNNKKKTMIVLEKSNTKKSTESKYYDPEDEDDDEGDEEEEEEEGIKLCCLQALKFSAGKMNLGMGKPNLMKISKAFKGIGWLHHHVGKHGRKG